MQDFQGLSAPPWIDDSQCDFQVEVFAKRAQLLNNGSLWWCHEQFPRATLSPLKQGHPDHGARTCQLLGTAGTIPCA